MSYGAELCEREARVMTGFWEFGKCPDNLLSSVFIQSHGGTLCAGLGTEHIACVLPHDLLLGYRDDVT